MEPFRCARKPLSDVRSPFRYVDEVDRVDVDRASDLFSVRCKAQQVRHRQLFRLQADFFHYPLKARIVAEVIPLRLDLEKDHSRVAFSQTFFQP